MTSTRCQYLWEGADSVTWWLVEGKVLTHMDGTYQLRGLGDGTTEVTYRLALDVAIPLIGMIKRKGEKTDHRRRPQGPEDPGREPMSLRPSPAGPIAGG